ncbi:MAG: TolC family protein [Deltaproteobacteria bacterium]|nr:MAG: TolC family protein [Deltaproteobacteria bacterium]
MSSVIKKTWKNSPEIRAEENLVSVSRAEKLRRFIPNEPLLTYSNTDNNTAQSYGASVTMAFPGKSIAMTTLDIAQEKAQRAELKAKKYEIAGRVIQNFLDCSTTQMTLKLSKENLSDLESLAKTLSARYEAGSSTQSELMSVQLQISQQNMEIAQLEDHAVVFCDKLNQMVHESVSPSLSLPDDLDPEIIKSLGFETADEAQSKAALKVAQARYKTAIWNLAPDLTFGVSRNHYSYLPGSPNGQETTTNYVGAISFPIFGLFHERLDIKRAKNQAIIDERTAQIQNIEALSEKEQARKDLKINIERLHQIRNHDLPLALGLVESTLASYQSGKLGFAEVLLARKTLLEIRSQDIQLRGMIINSRFKSLSQEGFETQLRKI